MIYLKWTHPDWDKFLITETNETQESVAENYVGDGDPKLLVREEVDMTKEEFEAMSEWDG